MVKGIYIYIIYIQIRLVIELDHIPFNSVTIPFKTDLLTYELKVMLAVHVL